MLDFNTAINIFPVEIIQSLKKTIQNPKYHAEGSVFNHIELVYNELLKENNNDLLVSALFHDLGKIYTLKISDTDKGLKIQTLGHEQESLIKSFILDFSSYFNKYFINLNWEKILFICTQHMRAHKYLSGEITNLKKKNLFETHIWANELLIFAKADAVGRLTEKKIPILIITLGIPGSGKTTWKKGFIQRNNNFISICPDDYRKELTGDISNISKDYFVWEKVYNDLDTMLCNNKDVVFDSTACNIKTQEKIEEIAKKYKTYIFYKIFYISLEDAKIRIKNDILNGEDRSNVPEPIVDNMYKNFNPSLKRVYLESDLKNIFIIK
jgi:predicted kinase